MSTRPNFDAMPPRAKAMPHWVVWKLVLDPDRPKPKKVPYNPATGAKADSTDPATWTSFHEAVKVYKRKGSGYAGVGFVLTDSGFVGTDLDDCRDTETGELATWSQEVIAELAGYAEVSTSDTGAHILVEGVKPEGRCKRKTSEYEIEMYDTGRFFVMTGNVLDGPADIPARQEQLDAVHAKWLGIVDADKGNVPSDLNRSETISDEDVVEAARERFGESFDMLYDEGDTSGQSDDHSKSDYALLCMLARYSRNEGQLERIFGESGLGARRKWTSRPKYRRDTIKEVLRETYDETPEGMFGGIYVDVLREGPVASTEKARKPPRGISAADLQAKVIPPTRWAVEMLLAEGLAVLAGRPKLGKSWLTLQLCIDKATGSPFMGFFNCAKGEAAYLALEDGEKRLQGRLEKMLGNRAAPEGLHFYTDWSPLDQGGLDDIDALLTENPAIGILVIDTYQKIRPLKKPRGANAYEVDYAEASKLKRLADKHHCCILLVHHLRKSQGQGGDIIEMVSGSTGLTGSADAILIMDRVRNTSDADFHVIGRDVEEGVHGLIRDEATMAWNRQGVGGLHARSPEQQTVLDAVKRLQSAAPKDVVEATGLDKDYVRNALGKLVTQGLIHRASYGKYEPTGLVEATVEAVDDPFA